MSFAKMRKKYFTRQIDLANKIGVKNTTISMWETGKSKPSIDMLPKLAELLKVNVGELVDCFSEEISRD